MPMRGDGRAIPDGTRTLIEAIAKGHRRQACHDIADSDGGPDSNPASTPACPEPGRGDSGTWPGTSAATVPTSGECSA